MTANLSNGAFEDAEALRAAARGAATWLKHLERADVPPSLNVLVKQISAHLGGTPDTAGADAAIVGLGHLGRALCLLGAQPLQTATPSRVQQHFALTLLGHACRQLADSWQPVQDRLVDLAGAAADHVATRVGRLDDGQRWAVGIELATTARRMVEFASESPTYERVPAVNLLRRAASGFDKSALRMLPSTADWSALDAPIVDLDQPDRQSLATAAAGLACALEHDARTTTLDVAAALAVCDAATDAAQAAFTVADRLEATPPQDSGAGWAQTPEAWQVLHAALVRFDDGSRRHPDSTSLTQRWAQQLQAAVADLPHTRDPSARADAATMARGAVNHLPAIARRLEQAVERWADEGRLIARARNLPRSDTHIDAVLRDRVVTATPSDVGPVVLAAQVTRRLSASLSSELDRTAGRVGIQPQPHLAATLALDARTPRCRPRRRLRTTPRRTLPANDIRPSRKSIGTRVSHAADVNPLGTTPPTGDITLLRNVTTAAADILTAPPRRAAALIYLRQRGIDTKPLPPEWLLGYAPAGWTRLVDKLRTDFDEQALIDAGVARRSSRGTLIDTFRDRVIFGIRDADGHLAGFIGRDLSGDPNAPKYLNTRQHALFDKGKLLYGLHEGNCSWHARQPVVVEGPLDVLAIAAARTSGNDLLPVAPCGTAFTITHARHVAEVAFAHQSPVVVAMDGDAAGRAAALTAGENLRYTGLDVRLAVLANGLDPADYLNRAEANLDTFRADNGLPLVTVQVQKAIAAQGDRMQWIEGRLVATRSIAGYLATYPPSYTARQIGWLADALNLDASTITFELADAYRRVDSGRGVPRSSRVGRTPSEGFGRRSRPLEGIA